MTGVRIIDRVEVMGFSRRMFQILHGSIVRFSLLLRPPNAVVRCCVAIQRSLTVTAMRYSEAMTYKIAVFYMRCRRLAS